MNAVNEMHSLMNLGVHFTQASYDDLFKEWAGRQGVTSTRTTSADQPAYRVTMV